MKNLRYLIFISSLGMFSCSNPQTKAAENEDARQLNGLLNNYYEDRMKLFPMDATALGDNRYNDQYPNTISQAYLKELDRFYSTYKTRLQAYDRATLSETDQMNYDVLLWECNIGLESRTFKDYLMPINQSSSNHLLIPPMADGTGFQPFVTVKDYDNWLKRLDGYFTWLDTARANMRTGMKQGYVIPRCLAVKLVPQFEAFDHGPVHTHMFYKPIIHLPAGFSKEDKERLTQAYTNMIEKKLIPTYKQMKEFLVREYIPACGDNVSIVESPLGRSYYDFQVKYHTTTTLSAEQIFDIGEKEVNRITAEMEKVKNEVGFKGDLKAFFQYVLENKKLLPFTTPQQVLDHFQSIYDRMKPHLATLFNKTPQTKFEIRRVPAFMELTSSAYYLQGSNDGSRPGIFYTPIPDPKKHNIYVDEALFLHEAIPGHHYQTSLQAEDTTLPSFRRTLVYNAYNEGWALYTESLGKELGLYQDPYLYFGKLGYEMHRALRLVLDAGLHTKRWTREQAIQYSKDHEARSEQVIISEVERYIARPGQALSYKTGQLKISELRTKAEQELGPKFNVAAFHDEVLSLGCVPLQLLEEDIIKWINREKKTERFTKK
jgi:uncharacterized protein (DUF885 family)